MERYTRSDMCFAGGLGLLIGLLMALSVFLFMDIRNLDNELRFMKAFQDSITEENLQTIMCNGVPTDYSDDEGKE